MKIEIFDFIQSYIDDNWKPSGENRNWNQFTKGIYLVDIWHNEETANIFAMTAYVTCIGVYDIFAKKQTMFFEYAAPLTEEHLPILKSLK